MTKKQTVVFEATAKQYSGQPKPFQVDDWVYCLLPVAITHVEPQVAGPLGRPLSGDKGSARMPGRNLGRS